MKRSLLLFLTCFLILSLKAQDSVNVTFHVNMENEAVDPGGVYVAGGSQFGNPGDNQLTDTDMDGIYSATIRIPKLTGSNYIFTNGNCPTFNCKESVVGTACADTSNFNDRFLPPVNADTVISTCFSQCTDSAVCAPPPTAVDVTFRIDMFESTIAPTGVYLGANFDGWSGNIQMTDPDNDLVFEVVINLEPGTYQYRFINGQNWANPEVLDPNETTCTITSGGNRELVVAGSGDVVLDASCFGVCAACEPHHSVTFQVDMSEETVASTGVFLAGGFEGWAGAMQLSDPDGDNIYSTKIPLLLGRYEFKYINGAAWASPEGLDSTDVSCTATSNENTNRVIIVDTADLVLDASCFGRCANCENSTGLADLIKDNSFYRISPSPANEYFYLTFPDRDRWDKELRIIDISGKEVISDIIPSQSQEMMINTQELAEGIYFVLIKMGPKLGTHKIVVRH